MGTHSTRGRALPTALLLSAALVACDDAMPPVSPVSPTTGSIRVTTAMTGQDLDWDGFHVTLDSGTPIAVAPNGSLTYNEVTPGSREIRIGGVATNCTVGGGTAHRVTVTAGEVASLALVTTCVTQGPVLPDVGTLLLTTNTTGAELDPNGYSILVNRLFDGPSTSLFLPINGSVKLELPPGGLILAALSGVSSNCHAVGEGTLTRSFALKRNETLDVKFDIECEPGYPTRLAAGSQLAFVREGGIHLVNSDGTGVVKLTDGPTDCYPAWSPDGARIAFVRGCDAFSTAIYIMNADGSNLVRRAQGDRISYPKWSPDGLTIAFASVTNGSSNLFLVNATDDGTSPRELWSYPGWDGQPAWSPDGKSIAFASDYQLYDLASDLYAINVTDRSVKQITALSSSSMAQYYEPAWSPDGSLIAADKCWPEFYTCDSGVLSVLDRQGLELRQLASIRGWSSPSWSPDGKTIAFALGNDINWIEATGLHRGFVVANGSNPAWRPQVASRKTPLGPAM